MIRRIFKKNPQTRALPRVRLDNIIRYKLDTDPSNSYCIANVKNISASGILIISKDEIAYGKMLDMSINFPGLDAFETKAQVARVRRTNAGDYEIGLHFITIDAQKKSDLEKRIAFILRKIKEHKSLWGQIKRLIK